LPRTSTHPRLPSFVILYRDHLWNWFVVGHHPRLCRRERDHGQQPQQELIPAASSHRRLRRFALRLWIAKRGSFELIPPPTTAAWAFRLGIELREHHTRSRGAARACDGDFAAPSSRRLVLGDDRSDVLARQRGLEQMRLEPVYDLDPLDLPRAGKQIEQHTVEWQGREIPLL
jgi:hypothetical protein